MQSKGSIIERVKRLLPRNRFARGVGVLAGGNGGAQLLAVLAAPILARLYTPEDFGLLAVYAGLLSVCLVTSCLRYELAIPLPDCDREAAAIASLCLGIVVAMTLATGSVALTWNREIALLLGTPLLADYLWLLPVGVLLGGFYQIFSYWSVRTRQFPAVAATKIKQSLAMIAIQLCGFKVGPLALLGGQAAGHAVGGVTLARCALKRGDFKEVTAQGASRAATRYRQFPFFSAPASLFNTTGAQLPPILFAALFSPAAAGCYALANRVLAVPISVLGSAIGSVFLSNAADAFREGTLGVLVAGTHRKLAHIAMPPMMIVVVAGPDLFAAVFGEQWREAGKLARLMAPWLYMVFVTSPFSTVFSVMEKQQRDVVFQVALMVVRAASIIVGAYSGGLYLTVALFSFSSTLCWVVFLFWISLSSGTTWATIASASAGSFLWGSCIVLPLSTAILLTDSPFLKMGSFAVTLLLALTRLLWLYRFHLNEETA